MLKIKNKDVAYVFELLDGIELPLRLTRSRNKFIDPMRDYYIKHIETGRQSIIDQFADKDEEGNVIKSEDNTVYVKDVEGLNNEMEIFDNESYGIDLNEVNLKLINDVYLIITNDEYMGKLKGEIASTYERLCTEIENVVEV